MIGSQIKTYESILYIIIFIYKKNAMFPVHQKKKHIISLHFTFLFFIRKLYEDTQWNK